MSEVTTMTEDTCRFCAPNPNRKVLIEGEHGFAALDLHPVNKGHFLVIPYRHFSDYFEINDEELKELWSLVAQGKDIIEKEHNPDAYNIGINVGPCAGQSIPHLHIHVIPRYQGDVDNPKGGVRGVVPERKLYTFKN